MAAGLAWTDLTEADVALVRACADSPTAQFRQFCECAGEVDFGRRELGEDTRMIYAELVTEMLFLGFRFAESKGWSAEQTSTYVSLLKRCVLDSFFGTDDGGDAALSMEASYKRFARHVKAHAVPRPPECSSVFQLTDVVDIIDHASTTFFKHYRSHRQTFSKTVPPGTPSSAAGNARQVRLHIPRPQFTLPRNLDRPAAESDVRVFEPASTEVSTAPTAVP